MPDGAWSLLGIVIAGLGAWFLSRRKDRANEYQATADGDAAYAQIAKQAWDETAKIREELARSQSERAALQGALARADEDRKRDRAITAQRFTLITPLMEECLVSHPEHEKAFAEFRALQWTEKLNGGATA